MEGGRGDGVNEDSPMIPRPAGTAGSKWSIQVEMGLGGAGKKYDSYKAIQVGALRQRWIFHLPTMHTYAHGHTHFLSLQRSIRDLVHNARLNWELPWREIPPRDKAALYEVVSRPVYHEEFTNIPFRPANNTHISDGSQMIGRPKSWSSNT
jgi:hypothetical protein